MIGKTSWVVKVDDKKNSFKDRLFKCRDLTEQDINLSICDVHDYSTINDIDMFLFVTINAIKNKKRIIIIGDYDVDGVMSTYELYSFLLSVNANVNYIIPDRMKDGYGLSDGITDKIIEQKYDVVITVDNGIAAIEQIQKIIDSGAKVLVTDHHECKEILPNATAVIDCKRPDNTYPFKELCGAGLVLKLIQALSDELGLPEETWKNYIEFAALATVADVVPLINENRIIVTEGLKRIKTTKNIALLNLLRVADKLDTINSLSSEDIGYYIAPLINASSRVGSVDVAMNLLLTNSEEEAIKYSDELKRLNELRKKIEAEIIAEANLFLVKNYDFTSTTPIVVYGDNWHKGVIGIVASRLVDDYSKPAIILSKTEDGLYHGSCRTFGNINIIKLLDSSKENIMYYGGHEGAAGLTISPDKLNLFIENINNYAFNNYSEETFIPVSTADMVINFDEINISNFKYTNTFAPFGASNPDPVFVLNNARIESVKKIGQKKGFENAHLKITVSDANNPRTKNIIEGIGFFNSDYADIIKCGDVVDIMFKPSINVWNEKETAQMQIINIKSDIPQPCGLTTEENAMFESGITTYELAEEYEIDIKNYIPSRDECFQVYKALNFLINKQTRKVIVADLDILSLIISALLKNAQISPFKLARIIEMNEEAGYFFYKKMLFGKIILALKEDDIIRISDTETYKRLEEERMFIEDES